MAAACLTSPYCCAPLAVDGMYGPTGANAKPHRRWLRPRMAGGTHMDRGGCTRRVAPVTGRTAAVHPRHAPTAQQPGNVRPEPHIPHSVRCGSLFDLDTLGRLFVR